MLESQFPVTVNVPVPVRVPVNIVLVTSMFVPVVEIVPLIVRLKKLLLEFRKLMVLLVPAITTVLLAPFVNVEPAPEESQLPLTVTVAVDRVNVPLVPPVIVMLSILLAIVLIVTTPRVPMVREPTDPPLSPVLAAEASSVIVPPAVLSWTVRVAPHVSGLVESA